MAKSTQGIAASAQFQPLIRQLRDLESRYGSSGFLIAMDDDFPTGDVEVVVRVQRGFITQLSSVALALVRDIGIGPPEARKRGIWPEGENETVGEALQKTLRLLATWESLPMPGRKGLPIGKTLLYAGLGVGALMLLRPKSDATEALAEVPFGALGSKSRSLRVGLMGGVAGLGAIAGSMAMKDSVFGPALGGALGATAFAALATQRFELDLPRLALYGGASGLAGGVLADQFVTDVDESNPLLYYARAAAGAFFGGAASSLTVDSFAPPEFKVRDDLTEAEPAKVSVSGGDDLPAFSVVDAPPADAVDLNGFIDL